MRSAGKLSARDLAAAVTNLLDDTHIMKLNNTEEHDKFLQQQPKLAKVSNTHMSSSFFSIFLCKQHVCGCA